MDVLIRTTARRLARRALVEAGFHRTAYDRHSTTFTRGRLKVDVHGWLRRAPAYRLDERLIWSSAQPVTVAGLEARTLSDEFALVMLLLSLFEDVGQGTTRLKQLLDGYLLLRQMDAVTDWDAFFDRRARENLASIAGTILDLLVTLFHADRDTPHLRDALETRRASFTTMTRAEMLDLVFAPRKDPRNLEWFRRVYPGSLPRYLLWFWMGGFPANVRAPSLSHASAAARSRSVADDHGSWVADEHRFRRSRIAWMQRVTDHTDNTDKNIYRRSRITRTTRIKKGTF